MIAFVRTASIAPGKIADALAFAHGVSKFVKEKFGVNVSINVPIGGNPNRIAFVSTYSGLSECEALMTRMTADADYMTPTI